MYKRSKKIISNKLELGNYIEDFDIYNSLFLRELLNPSLNRVDYLINNFELRPDLIAKDFYGSDEYTAILIIQTGAKLEDLVKGNILHLLPKETVDAILNNM